jgi:Uma2 family endonuclease
MATAKVKKSRPSWKTMADLLEGLGNIPPERVWFDPLPGAATEKDLIAVCSGVDRRLCELVHGTLVEKAMGTREAAVGGWVIHLIMTYLDREDRGVMLGANGMFRLQIGLVRIPGAAFISWDRLPEGELPDEAIASCIPELMVEVLRAGNTAQEMNMKVAEYFKAGVKLVWLIDPKTQTGEEYTSPTESRHVGKTQALDGHDVLPGFTLSLKQLFSRTKRHGKNR